MKFLVSTLAILVLSIFCKADEDIFVYYQFPEHLNTIKQLTIIEESNRRLDGMLKNDKFCKKDIEDLCSQTTTSLKACLFNAQRDGKAFTKKCSEYLHFKASECSQAEEHKVQLKKIEARLAVVDKRIRRSLEADKKSVEKYETEARELQQRKKKLLAAIEKCKAAGPEIKNKSSQSQSLPSSDPEINSVYLNLSEKEFFAIFDNLCDEYLMPMCEASLTNQNLKELLVGAMDEIDKIMSNK